MANPLNEINAAQEYLQLQVSPILRGEGLPTGDGRAVVVLPGLFANDLYLSTMRSWLKRLGYQPIASRIALNVGCPKRLLQTVTKSVQRAIDADQPLAIIGHSRGGMLAQALAVQLGPRVSHMIVIGSPLGGLLAAGPENLQRFADAMQNTEVSGGQWLFNAGKAASQMFDPNCEAPFCGCSYYQAVFSERDKNTRVTSIYSTEDPIVPPIMSALPGVKNIEVTGTHSGLMFNADVLEQVAKALADQR